MTSTDLRALIAGAEELPPYTVSPTARPEQSLRVRGDSYRASTQLPTGVANLIAGVVNNAERFAELLAAEEAKTASVGEWRECLCYPEERNLWFDGSVWGWVAPEGDGWTAHADRFLVDYEKAYPTEAEARAAVEAAVRAGR